ncbi:MAG: TIGR02300 family protein [Alphaproteobacteria bacterium]|nr:TIGR02300 family protein [Alphaproteobacteria bacterium]
MVQAEWGIKRLCQGCGALFYDFDRDPIVCPKCSAEFDPDAILKSRRGRGVVEEKPVEEAPKKVAAVANPSEAEAEAAKEEEEDDLDLPDVEEDDEEIDEELAAEDTDDDLMEDTSDLGEDESDMAEVMEHREEKE